MGEFGRIPKFGRMVLALLKTSLDASQKPAGSRSFKYPSPSSPRWEFWWLVIFWWMVIFWWCKFGFFRGRCMGFIWRRIKLGVIRWRIKLGVFGRNDELGVVWRWSQFRILWWIFRRSSRAGCFNRKFWSWVRAAGKLNSWNQSSYVSINGRYD